MRKQTLQSLFFFISVIILASCKGIPNSYIGEYQDSTGRIDLELDVNEGTLKLADGRSINGKLEEVKFDLLKDGKRALYARSNSQNGDLVEIFLVQPNMSTKQEVSGLIWYEAEITYSLINSKDSGASRNITLVHCRRGQVLLDAQTTRVQLGCPEAPERLELKKIRDGRRGDDYGGGGP